MMQVEMATIEEVSKKAEVSVSIARQLVDANAIDLRRARTPAN